MIADRDPAAVVDDGHRVVGVDRDRDGVVAAGQRLVNRVVDNLVDEVVKPARARRADVHAGALADRLQALEDGDVLRVVTWFGVGARSAPSSFVNDPPIDVATPRSRAVARRAGASKLGVQKNSTVGALNGALDSRRFCLQNARKCCARSSRLCPTATQRRRVIRAARAERPLRRSMIVGAIRSSSCAHTAAEQATVRRRRARRVGCASARDRLPDRRPARRAGSPPAGVAGASSSRSGSSAAGHRSRGSAVQRHRADASGTRTSWPARRRPTNTRSTPGSSAPGHVVEVGRRDQRLPAAVAQQVDQRRAAVGVELAHHVVEQHQRRRVGRRPAIASRSASSSASSASRCWPCEP